MSILTDRIAHLDAILDLIASKYVVRWTTGQIIATFKNLEDAEICLAEEQAKIDAVRPEDATRIEIVHL